MPPPHAALGYNAGILDCDLRLAAQHDVQTIFGASDEIKAFLCGGVLPMFGAGTFEDLLERTVDGKGICDFAKGHQ